MPSRWHSVPERRHRRRWCGFQTPRFTASRLIEELFIGTERVSLPGNRNKAQEDRAFELLWITRVSSGIVAVIPKQRGSSPLLTVTEISGDSSFRANTAVVLNCCCCCCSGCCSRCYSSCCCCCCCQMLFRVRQVYAWYSLSCLAFF